VTRTLAGWLFVRWSELGGVHHAGARHTTVMVEGCSMQRQEQEVWMKPGVDQRHTMNVRSRDE